MKSNSLKEITVFYTNGKETFETCVTYKTVLEAISAVKEELNETEYHVLVKKTIERFNIDYVF